MKRRSQPSTIGTPMPATGPLIAPMIGLGTDSRYVYVPRRSSPHDSSPGTGPRDPPTRRPSVGVVPAPPSAPDRLASRFMSAPAQKPLPAPVNTMPTTAGSAAARPTASRTSSAMTSVQALSDSGRLRVIVATSSATP